jgi:hypothetical protein
LTLAYQVVQTPNHHQRLYALQENFSTRMKTAILTLALAIPLLFAMFSAHPVYAHTATMAGDIKMEVGWGTEPPLLGQLNTISVEVSKVSDGKPVANAFASAEVTISKGGDSKKLEVLPGESAGLYTAQIIPTQLGQITVTITGTIAGQKVNNQVNIEDVQDTKILNFPASGGANTGGGSDQGVPQGFVDQMRSVISDLTNQIESAKTSAQSASNATQKTAQDISSIKSEADRAYLVGMVGIGVGIAGIAVATRALSRKA